MSDKFNSYKQSLLNSSAPDLSSTTIKAMLLSDTDYTFSAAHDFLNDIAAFRYLGTTDQTLASKTITNGTFDSANPTFMGVVIDGAKTVGTIILYQDSGTAATSPLIAYYDAFTPVTPNGNNIEVQVHASGWFSV